MLKKLLVKIYQGNLYYYYYYYYSEEMLMSSLVMILNFLGKLCLLFFVYRAFPPKRACLQVPVFVLHYHEDIPGPPKASLGERSFQVSKLLIGRLQT
jgi:hypothetical protein